ncbi:MAG: Calx-beta domain-containing protein [Cyanobacteria bacterium P01_F01_bin.150]
MNSVFHDSIPPFDRTLAEDRLTTVDAVIEGQTLFGNRSRRSLLSANISDPLKLTIKGKGERVVGTAANDSLNASKGKGNNILLGKKGNDRLKGKTKDKLIGGPGNDRLDTRNGNKNILKGGGGNDRFFVGKKDTASGGGGADILNALKGRGQNILKGGGGDDVLLGKMGDRLIGGGGADEFVLVKGKLPKRALTVQDFQQGRDRLSIQNFPDATTFSDLTLTQQNADTLITIQGQSVAILENVTATQLTSDDIDGIASTPDSSPPSIPNSPPSSPPSTPNSPPSTPNSPSSPLQISITDDEVFEGNPGDDRQVTFVVSLNRPADQDVTITYQTVSVPDGAIPNTDYVPTQGTLTIPAGATSRPIDVSIIEDVDDENNERFELQLLSADGATISDGQAIGLIKDDEDEAIGTQQSNTYSITSIDAQSLNTQFEFSGMDGDGHVIPDSDPDNLAGRFVGAITNYRSGSGQIPPGDPIPFEPDKLVEYPTLDLRARYIESSDQDDEIFLGRDTIEYAFIAPDKRFIRYFRFDFSKPFFSFLTNFNQNEAVNSITHILENDLLEYIQEVGFSDNKWSIIGGSKNTQPSKTYSKVRTSNGIEILVSQFTLVTGYEELDINDANSSFVEGAFDNAIADYSNTELGITFPQGNLTVELMGNVLQYTISSVNSPESVSASINLSLIPLDSNLAVNNLKYILDNDVLKLAFFPTE